MNKGPAVTAGLCYKEACRNYLLHNHPPAGHVSQAPSAGLPICLESKPKMHIKM